MTVGNVFTTISSILSVIWSVFGNVASTIMDNPLFLSPVLISLAAGIIFFAIGIVRKMGIRGVSSGGRRKGR